jgi:hypothetical protein
MEQLIQQHLFAKRLALLQAVQREIAKIQIETEVARRQQLTEAALEALRHVATSASRQTG